MGSRVRVFAFCPVYRLEPETVTALCHQEPHGGGLSVLFGIDNPHPQRTDPRGIQNVLHQYTRGREMFLASGADWLWILESDIIPPTDALARMVRIAEDHDADIVRLPYLFRQPWPNKVAAMTKHMGHGARNRGEPFTEPWPEGVQFVSGSGLGCALVRRDIVESVPFRDGGRSHCDSYWNDDVWYAGFTRQYADWSAWCGHKTPEGLIINGTS